MAPILALAVVGASTFPAPYGPTRNLVNEIVAFVVSAVTIGMWKASEQYPAAWARLAARAAVVGGVMVVWSRMGVAEQQRWTL